MPTPWGWALLLAVLAAAAFACGAGAYGFLAPTQPARGARVLVVEGWIESSALDEAAALARRGRYEHVLTTGGPIDEWLGLPPPPWPSYAQRAAAHLGSRGIAGVVAVPSPPVALERTFTSAVAVREWARRTGTRLDAIDLVSADAHARRSRMLYRMALGDAAEVGVIAAEPHRYDARRWWAGSEGAKRVLGEAIGLAWTVCCFWPPQAPQLPAPSQSPPSPRPSQPQEPPRAGTP